MSIHRFSNDGFVETLSHRNGVRLMEEIALANDHRPRRRATVGNAIWRGALIGAIASGSIGLAVWAIQGVI